MTEKRQYERFQCKMKVDFKFYEGDPEEINKETAISIKGKGFILDISKGGVFIVSNSRVSINQPMEIFFATKKKKYNVEGTIVRTGLLKNNPSEVAKKYASSKVKGDTYIAVQFKNIIDDISREELKS